MILINKCILILTAALPVSRATVANKSTKLISCLLPLDLEMTKGGGFIQRRSINIIIVKMEMKADRVCGEFCTALNYINTGFFSSSSVLELRYTQNSLGNKQIQY